MGADAGTEARARWYRTPLRDLVRGRVSGRLDLDLVVGRYGLPGVLARYVKDAARRARLGRLDRSELAAGLAARVVSLLNDGHESEEIMQGLGNPRTLGRALRREHLRGKSILWKTYRLSRMASWVSLSLLVPVYVYLAVRFHTAQPKVKRNFAREMSARAMSIPEVDRALPLYLEAMASLPSVPRGLDKTWPRISPGDPEWTEAAAYLKACAPGLEVLRRAASKPGVGFVLTDATDPRWSHSAEERAKAPERGTENPPVLNVMLPHLGSFRWSARLLAADIRAAAADRDPVRVVADAKAMLGVAEHSAESPVLVAELVSFAILAVDCGALGEVIERYPGLLRESELAELASAIKSYGGGGRLLIHLEDPARTIEDYFQRAYTDDGHGDGRMCAAGLRYLDSMKSGSGPGALSLAGAVFGPINVQLMASRKELHNKWEELLKLARRDAEVPAWQRTEFLLTRETERIESDPDLENKFRILCILLPAIAKAIEASEQATEQRDATLVVIALERYRLAKGAYPGSLDSLVPQFLSTLPVDHYDGRPIKYRVIGGKPLVYCCGSDADDDGGRMPAGWRGNDKARRWIPPARRAQAPDGDLVLWPEPPEPKREE